jgi:hypothetical protein
MALVIRKFSHKALSGIRFWSNQMIAGSHENVPENGTRDNFRRRKYGYN